MSEVAEVNEDRIILVNLSKTGYPVVKTLTNFSLILSCVKNHTFLTAQQIINDFQDFVEIEKDEDVEIYFQINCRRVLEEAILEGWVAIKIRIQS